MSRTSPLITRLNSDQEDRCGIGPLSTANDPFLPACKRHDHQYILYGDTKPQKEAIAIYVQALGNIEANTLVVISDDNKFIYPIHNAMTEKRRYLFTSTSWVPEQFGWIMLPPGTVINKSRAQVDAELLRDMKIIIKQRGAWWLWPKAYLYYGMARVFGGLFWD